MPAVLRKEELIEISSSSTITNQISYLFVEQILQIDVKLGIHSGELHRQELPSKTYRLV